MIKKLLYVGLCVLMVGCADTSKYGVSVEKSEEARELFKRCKEWRQPYPYKGNMVCYVDEEEQYEVKMR